MCVSKKCKYSPNGPLEKTVSLGYNFSAPLHALSPIYSLGSAWRVTIVAGVALALAVGCFPVGGWQRRTDRDAMGGSGRGSGICFLFSRYFE